MTPQRAVLFADVCESTGIYQALGDNSALQLVNRLFAQLSEKVAQHGGTVVKTLGDGMVCQFDGADGAFRAACDMQAAAGRMKPAGHPRLMIKIGFTWGPVVLRANDVFGDTVNVSARLMNLAGPDQVVTTQQTVDALSPALRPRCRPLYPVKVKGRVGEVMVCEVLWRSDPDLTAIQMPRPLAAREGSWILRLTYAGETVNVEPTSEVNLGREPSNQLVVASASVSRTHARIYGRDGNFVIADRSSNGTWLLVDGNSRELLLRREESLMGERGWIGLGAPASTPGEHCVRYRIERKG